MITYNDSLVPNEGYPVYTMASFTCDHGYNLIGINTVICQTSRDWNQQPPNCDQGNFITRIY